LQRIDSFSQKPSYLAKEDNALILNYAKLDSAQEAYFNNQEGPVNIATNGTFVYD
jgi:hypothetical protein